MFSGLWLLLLFCLLLLEGVVETAAFAPEKWGGKFCADEALLRPEKSMQTSKLHLKNPVWEAELTLGSTALLWGAGVAILWIEALRRIAIGWPRRSFLINLGLFLICLVGNIFSAYYFYFKPTALEA